jgi:hypothetical protein
MNWTAVVQLLGGSSEFLSVSLCSVLVSLFHAICNGSF